MCLRLRCKTPDKNGDTLLHVVIVVGEDIDLGLQNGEKDYRVWNDNPDVKKSWNKAF